MPLPSTAALLRLVLLATPPEATSARPSLPACEPGPRHLELTADAPQRPPEVCIHLGLPTTFFFDTRLARLELPGRERFRMLTDTAGFALVPTGPLADGERVAVTVYFQDGAAPESATFSLVVHPSAAEPEVQVTRRPRTLASLREGEQRARAEARQCREDKALLETECSGKVGLRGLIAQGLLGEGGIVDKNLEMSVVSRPGNTLISTKARSYRSATGYLEGGREVVRLAVEQELTNNGHAPWTPAGALLLGPRRAETKVLGVWPLEPIAPGMKVHVVVEVEATLEAARGTFTLKLWGEEGGGRSELFDGVSFP
ncbi:MAG TPA: DUF2381 family protein [Archangium sp.]|uniref:DUF2381 family protein n=1 Tax=Archangium sp. TaxID=1872627 RepID=UPI002E347513|nr:DUF2381 family protein [Archangium sp.]HEX5751829.1 DUF2381 family protein [Archangium sp.]